MMGINGQPDWRVSALVDLMFQCQERGGKQKSVHQVCLSNTNYLKKIKQVNGIESNLQKNNFSFQK